MKIFITGATGFVGSNLCEFLVKQGHEIVALVHDIPTNFVRKTPMFLAFGDVRDFKRMREILYKYKPDAIVHLAAQAIVSQGHINPISTYETNVTGTINLLEAWKEACPNAYFLYFSTDKVYGNGLNKKESNPVVATYDPYQASKAAADIIAQSYGATVTRSCNIYGPGDREQSRLVPYVLQCSFTQKRVMLRHPHQMREWIYIDDVCKILSWMLEQRKTGIWNVGSGKVASPLGVLNEIMDQIEIKVGSVEPSKVLELDEQSLNTEKLCGEMDCLAFTTLQAGITKTINWWKQQTEPRFPVTQAAGAPNTPFTDEDFRRISEEMAKGHWTTIKPQS